MSDNITKLKEKKASSGKRKKTESFQDRERKTDSFLVKLSPQDHDRIRLAAATLNQSKSEFVVSLALKKYQELGGSASHQHLEEKDGKWFYRGRKLEVFQNYYLFSTSKYSSEPQTWADLYSLPAVAVDEARQLCMIGEKKAYEAWVREYEKEEE